MVHLSPLISEKFPCPLDKMNFNNVTGSTTRFVTLKLLVGILGLGMLCFHDRTHRVTYVTWSCSKSEPNITYDLESSLCPLKYQGGPKLDPDCPDSLRSSERTFLILIFLCLSVQFAIFTVQVFFPERVDVERSIWVKFWDIFVGLVAFKAAWCILTSAYVEYVYLSKVGRDHEAESRVGQKIGLGIGTLFVGILALATGLRAKEVGVSQVPQLPKEVDKPLPSLAKVECYVAVD